jgi:hypothetical protein
VVLFPRQSGKNELQAQIECYLLTLLQRTQAEMVKVSPTWKPQSYNAMRRLERVLERNLLTRGRWRKEQGYIYRLGQARIFFLSGSPTANVVGATANTLLSCDEAQDVLISKWDKELAPMAAAANATRVFWGTAWTRHTLLAREKQAALDLERQDGVQRVFITDADQVRLEVPAYGTFVDSEIAKLGREHPFVLTQYYCQEIDERGGLFTPERLALLQGDHAPQETPRSGWSTAFLIDVGGEAGEGSTADHDATALTIVEVDPSGLEDPLQRAQVYRIVKRAQWVGQSQVSLYRRLSGLIEMWGPQRIVIDATGVGEGLAAFLERAAAGRVVRFKFTQASKSELGWALTAMIESGRLKDYCAAGGENGALQALFLRQAEQCRMQLLPGPGKVMRWGVPDGLRHPSDGAPVHDDLLLSLALCAVLDKEHFGAAHSAVITAPDPLGDLHF